MEAGGLPCSLRRDWLKTQYIVPKGLKLIEVKSLRDALAGAIGAKRES